MPVVKIKIDNKMTIILEIQCTSERSPDGKINILEIRAARVEYAIQLNHL